MKTPKIITKLSAVIKARRQQKLRAATRAASASAMEGSSDEPTTKLSSAFFVVFVLHVIAIGGIYAFNSIRASRASRENPPAPAVEPPKPAVAATVKNAPPPTITPRVAESTTATGVAGPAVPKPGALKQHQVKPGENATKIAAIYSLKPEELLAANNLKSDAVLHPGLVLTIPAAKPGHKPEAPAKAVNVAPTRTTPGLHIVRKGDTATSIAKLYGLAAEDLLKLNKISDAKKLQEGQPLTIPKKKG